MKRCSPEAIFRRKSRLVGRTVFDQADEKDGSVLGEQFIAAERMIALQWHHGNLLPRLFPIVLVALLGGCAVIPPPDRAARVLPLILEPMPIVVGVHYPAEFRNATHVRSDLSALPAPLRVFSQGTYFYRYGSDSVALLDAAFGSMFEKVLRIEHWPDSAPRSQAVSGVLVAEAVTVRAREELDRKLVTAEYTVSLYDSSGTLATSWNVRSREKSWLSGDAIHTAMTEAVAQLALTILDQKDRFGEWLRPSQDR